MMYGRHGKYDLAQGYFSCFKLVADKKGNPVKTLRDANFFAQDTRAIVMRATVQDVATKVNIDISLLFEQSAAGLVLTPIVKVIPFWLPFQNSDTEVVATVLITFRIILLIWLSTIIITTFCKRSSIRDMFSLDSLKANMFMTSILVLQIMVINYHLAADSVFEGIDMSGKGGIEHIIKFRWISLVYQAVAGLDAITLCLCLIYITLITP